MKVVHISTYDATGGAGIAAYRLHRALRESGIDSTMVVLEKNTRDPFVVTAGKDSGLPVGQDAYDDIRQAAAAFAFKHYIRLKRDHRKKCMFSYDYPGSDLIAHPHVAQADLIHLHWTTGMLCPMSMHRLQWLNKPIVCTFHDQRYMTAGCHSPGVCTKYKDGCQFCHLLPEESLGLSGALFKDQAALFPGRCQIVTPSKWLKQTLVETKRFEDYPVHFIPNCVDTEIFKPIKKIIARKQLGIKEKAYVLCHGAAKLDDPVKGFDLLVETLDICMEDNFFARKVDRGDIWLLLFGQESGLIEKIRMPCKNLGVVKSAEKLACIYSAADDYMLPSVQDNCPNTMLEAMACGTSVIGFASGGIPEVVIDQKTGWLAPTGDCRALADLILSSMKTKAHRQAGRLSRKRILDRHSPEKQAKDLLRLYYSFESGPNSHGTTSDSHSVMGQEGARILGNNLRRLIGGITEKMPSELSPDEFFLISLASSGNLDIDRLRTIDSRSKLSIAAGLLDFFTWEKGCNEKGESREPDRIARLFESLTSANVLNGSDFYDLGIALKNTGQVGGALQAANRAVQLSPGNCSHRLFEMNMLRFLGRFEECFAAAENACSIDPTNVNYRFLKGVALKELGRLEEALTAFRQLLPESRSLFASVKIFEGATLRDLGDDENAVRAFDTAVLHDQGNVTAREKKLEILQRNGCWDKAIAVIDELLFLSDDHERYLKMKSEILQNLREPL